jgi:hypothetical protein
VSAVNHHLMKRHDPGDRQANEGSCDNMKGNSDLAGEWSGGISSGVETVKLCSTIGA